MPNEIYHKSEWGNPKAEGFGDVYFDASATNKLYNHSDYYENSDGTDKILRDIPNKASIVLTPTAYSDGSLNTVIPPYAPSYIENIPFVTSEWNNLQEGWSIDETNNKLVAEATWTGTGKRAQYQVTEIGVGQTVRVSFDTVITAGSFKIGKPVIDNNVISTSGSYSLTGVATNDFLTISNQTTDFAGEITNIRVEVIEEADFDFSRGSSATRVNEQGLIEDVASNIPRIDYTGGTGALLLEPQRTNLITYSEDLSQWDTGGTAPVVTAVNNALTGQTNAYTVEDNDVSVYERIEINATTTAAAHTLTVFIKKKTSAVSSYSGIQMQSGNKYIIFDSYNGTYNTASGNDYTEISVDDYSSYWRLKATATTSSGSIRVALWGAISVDGTSISPNATGSETFYGVQLEQGSYQTSIIKTEGSTVTRSADVANNSGNADLINSTEGVLYVEIAALANSGNKRRISLSDGTDLNGVILSLPQPDDRIKILIKSGGAIQANSTDTVVITATDFNKIAAKYKDNDFALWVDGTKVFTDSSGSVPIGLNELSFNFNGGENFYGKVKALAVFKEALTDEELQALTT